MRSARGQATVELVGLLPLLVAVAFAAFTVLAAGAASEAARASAEAGAVALLQGGSAREAARRALPPWAPRRARIRVDGRRVIVAVRPRTPLDALDALLVRRAEAYAGP